MEGDIRLMEVPLVSVIIPMYNAGPYISGCLHSVLSQTWKNIEIIVVDDGSTDNSAAITGAFSDSGVRLIQQPNSGASVARNTGLTNATGKYIQFLDADDLINDQKIASQLEVLGGSEEYLALCPTAYFYDSTPLTDALINQEWYAYGSDDPIDFLARLYSGFDGDYGGMIQPNAWLTPRKLIDSAGLWNPMRNPDDDGEFFCRVILASKGVKYSDKGINYYRKFNKKTTWSNRGSHDNQSAVLQSWILKSQHLEPYRNIPSIRKALAFNFTELCYNNYPDYPDLSEKAKQMATSYGGLAHPPYFGNQLFNKLRGVLPWKILRWAQRYFHTFKTR